MGSTTRKQTAALSRPAPCQISRITAKAATGTALQKCISGDRRVPAKRRRKLRAPNRAPQKRAAKNPVKMRKSDPPTVLTKSGEAISLHNARAVADGPAKSSSLSIKTAASCQTQSQNKKTPAFFIPF